MGKVITIGDRKIGPGHPVFFVAEMSANHGQDFDEAVRIIRFMLPGYGLPSKMLPDVLAKRLLWI